MDFKLPSSQDLLAKKKAALKAKKEAAAKAAKAAQGSAPEPLPVLESSPEPPPVEPPMPQVEPPVVAASSPKPTEPSKKKRKVVEKGKKKMLANRSKRSKIASPASESDPRTSKDGLKRVELNLPSDISFLDDREASVMFMRQILSEADEEKMHDGDLQRHFDDLLWNSLKVNIQTMGLFYRTAEKVLEHQQKAKDLSKKDREREDKLIDIERKFEDVKASSENLVSELQSSLKSMEEGTEMTKVIVGQFEEAQAKIRALEADKASLEEKNSTLAAEKEVLAAAKASLEEKLLDLHERSTLKARYEVLKQHKQGLLVDAEVDEEIEMYELLSEPENPSSTADIEHPAQASVEVHPSARASGENEPAVQEDVTQDRDVRE